MGRKRIWIIGGGVCLLLLWVVMSLLVSRYGLQVRHYEVAAGVDAPVRIVQLSDLHNTTFGEKNCRLLEKVAAQQPDLIFCTGDFVDMTGPETDTAVDLIRELCKLAPVYFSLGNHEISQKQRFGVDAAAQFAAAGAKVLQYRYEDVTVKGQPLRIGGIYGYCLPEKYLVTGETRQVDCDFLHPFQDTERPTLLLCHMPVGWILNGSLEAWDVDLVFAGHAHGGQVKLPLLGGLYAPDQGFFPGRVEGLFQADGKTAVVSRGLGGTIPVPRFGNSPELVVVTLVPEK